MERYNPFAGDGQAHDPDPFTTNFNRSSETIARLSQSPNNSSSGTKKQQELKKDSSLDHKQQSTSRYTTSFPDPFGDIPIESIGLRGSKISKTPITTTTSDRPSKSTLTSTINNRSNSVTFAPVSHNADDSVTQTRSSRREASGFSSFLSRATSVTSNTVSDRVSGAVGSVRSAVDTISSQIQQAVPVNLNERISTTANNLIGGSDTSSTLVQQQQQQQQQSAASYLASKFSSATGQFSSGGQSPNTLPVISRQRVVLILDSLAEMDWAQEFVSYRRLIAGLGPATAQSALTSFFTSATAQLSSSSSSSNVELEADLIEQVDYRDISVLSNQSTSIATVFVMPLSMREQQSLGNSHNSSQQQSPLVRTNSLQQSTGSQSNNNKSSSSSSSSSSSLCRIIRPEYVVVRQRAKDKLDRLRSIVNALNYSLVPMFEPIDIWNIFQDKQLLFSKLLKIQKLLGKENFPLIPQIYCQTQYDLLNYLNSSSVNLPCLVRIIGPTGEGKIRIDNLKMFRDFSTIMASSGLSCTIEPYLDVKSDLVIQKFGTSLKSFKKNAKKSSILNQNSSSIEQDTHKGFSLASFGDSIGGIGDYERPEQQHHYQPKQAATKQSSIGSSVLSSLLPSSQQQQLARRSSNPAALAFEKVSEINVRYKTWVEAIESEFDNKIDAFCIKVAIGTNDREYIVGLRDCTMDFLGTLDNQDEDKRSFVELIISHMNTNLPKHSATSRATSLTEDNNDYKFSPITEKSKQTQNEMIVGGQIGEKKRFISQTLVNGSEIVSSYDDTKIKAGTSSGSHLGNRSQSVSVNKSDYMRGETQIPMASLMNRRSSDRSDSLTDTEAAVLNTSSGINQRQSLLDQTSTALSSFQKQSMSFFKRFDTQTNAGSNTPPQSAKSERSFMISASTTAANNTGSRGNGLKSQSVDSSGGLDTNYAKPARKAPPKPPPPPMSANRQSSLASYSSKRASSGSDSAATHSTPAQSRQNSSLVEGSSASRNRVIRQNSALSAFEPYDQDLSDTITLDLASSQASLSLDKARTSGENESDLLRQSVAKPDAHDVIRKNITPFDSTSITSGDSSSTGEDTMNNLKKTFASIFGDKCE